MSEQALVIDRERGAELARLLHDAFLTTGIHGRTTMPEDDPPEGVDRGSLEHLLFITLTVAIDYQMDANALWASARATCEDPGTRYLFDPAGIHQASASKVREDMAKFGLSKKHKKDPRIWTIVAVSFLKKWGGDPRRFLEDCGWDAPTILQRLKSDRHPRGKGQTPDFPFLGGNKIGPLWLRMLRDNVGLTGLRNLEKVPIPVDIHVARATLATGVVRGSYSGTVSDAFETIREAWFQSTRRLTVGGREMIALDVDEALWHLSKYGCTKRDTSNGACPMLNSCEAGAFCMPGMLKVDASNLEADI